MPVSNRTRHFFDLYTRDLSSSDFQRLFTQDTPDAYRFFSRHIDEARLSHLPPVKRWTMRAKLLFLAFSLKLSPARRALFGIAMVTAVIGIVQLFQGFGWIRITPLPITFFSISVPSLVWANGTGWLLAGFLLANLLILLEVADRLGLKNDLEIARDIQRAMLPQEPFAADGIEAAGWTRPANTVGGDFYDILAYPDGRVLVALGDVAGKGSPAALLMALLLAMLRTLVQEDLPPAALMERLNRLVHEQTPGSRFITMFLGLFDPSTGELSYVNAGQTPPLRLSGDRTERLLTGGIALGMFDAATYDVARCTLTEGDLVLMYSDGITEAERPDGTPFEEEGLSRFLRSCQMTPIDQIGPRVFDAVAAYAHNTKFADDLTALALRRRPVDAPENADAS